MQTATIFNIQKFSVNDGPGVRTVVFYKGCPLRCKWCANPESRERGPQVEWDAKDCTGCGHCIELCPEAGEITIAGKRHVDVRNLKADSPWAAQAIAECPGRCLSRVGDEKTVDEVFEVCMQDLPFYEESGGGVTISGGEALTWVDFNVELLSRLQEAGVDTCIETAAYVSAVQFDAVAAHLDHMLVDLKHWDPKAHKEGTGVGNELILRNIARGIESDLDVLVRTPVIPGFNDSLDDARGMARALREVGATRAQLLPFHNFGENKWDMLGLAYAYHGIKNLTTADLEDYRQVYLDEGVEAFF